MGRCDGSWRRTKTCRSFYEVHRRLEASVPAPQRVSILHNDLKFDNCQFQPEQSRSRDVDLRLGHGDARRSADRSRYAARLLERSQPIPCRAAPARSVRAMTFPTRADITRRYADVDRPRHWQAIDWYEAFALWKTSGGRAADLHPLRAGADRATTRFAAHRRTRADCCWRPPQRLEF